jgi:hypothetical protein
VVAPHFNGGGPLAARGVPGAQPQRMQSTQRLRSVAHSLASEDSSERGGPALLLDRPVIRPGRGGSRVRGVQVGGHPSGDLPVGDGVEEGVLAAEQIMDVVFFVPGGQRPDSVEVVLRQPDISISAKRRW